MTQAQQIKQDNAARDLVAQALADIRAEAIKQFIQSYETKNITASEFLTMTDNMLQDEFKQAMGRL